MAYIPPPSLTKSISYTNKKKFPNMDFTKSNMTFDQPTENDILCGRGKKHNKNLGNIKFSNMIKSNLQRYHDAQKPIERTIVVGSLLAEHIESDTRFFKKDPNSSSQWHQMSDEQAHDKIGHAIRDMLKATKTKNKKQRIMKSTRAAQKQQQQQQQQQTPQGANNKICFEPICFRSDTFQNDITKAFSSTTRDILASILLLVDDNDNGEGDHTIKNDFVAPIAITRLPELVRCCSDETVYYRNAHHPQQQQRPCSCDSVWFMKYHSLEHQVEDKLEYHDLTMETNMESFLF